MATPAAQNAVSRYRPAILVATGLAAAYGTYLLYTTFTEPSTPTGSRSKSLHRSNAVHRPQRARRHSVVIIGTRDGTDVQLRCVHAGRMFTMFDGRLYMTDISPS